MILIFNFSSYSICFKNLLAYALIFKCQHNIYILLKEAVCI